MKVKNLLVAALLLSGMAAFNACSEKDAIDEVTPPVEQPAEELETVLALTGAFGDNIQTRAGEEGQDDPNYRNPNDKEVIRCYGEYVFEVDESGKPSRYLTSYIRKSNKEDIFTEKNENYEGEGRGKGYYFYPLEFKTAAKKVAIVVVANCDHLFSDEAETAIIDFESFASFANEVTLPLLRNTPFEGYPMSSNVMIVDIKPGMYNGVGFSQNSVVNKALSANGFEKVDENKINRSTDNRIYLYRCWSLVKLTTLTVDTYADAATDAKFELEEAFVMNVPTKTNLFNTKIPSSWSAWGGELNVDLSTLISGTNPAFYSGYTSDNTEGDKENSDIYKDDLTYDDHFRTKAFADATKYYYKYNRSLDGKDVSKAVYKVTTPTSLDLSSKNYKNDDDKKLVIDPAANEDNLFTYVVAPSTYGKAATGGPNHEQSLVVVLKGKYSQKIGNGWYGTGEGDKIESSYYTVVVNEGADASALQTPNVANTVMRNVQYEIAMKVKGPGSPTPVAHLANTFIVPKITVVNFGTVRQSSAID